jgi:hypothetical protein
MEKENISIDEYEEASHLNILKDYYNSLKIGNYFTSNEMSWYNEFREAVAV